MLSYSQPHIHTQLSSESNESCAAVGMTMQGFVREGEGGAHWDLPPPRI